VASRVSSPVFVGRADELGELVDAMAGARAGTPGLVLVGGEAGVGKSRLVAELTAYARAADVQILAGQCVGFDEATIPLLPVIDVLRGLDDGGQDLLERGLASVSAEGPPVGLHPLVLDRLAAAAATAPILLIIEDVHWADRSTLELLAYLARRLRDERVLAVATYRSDEVDRHERLRRFLADVATAPCARRLALDRLTRSQTGEQLAGILGEPPPEPLLDAVFARAEGNPFFAEELVAAGPEGGEGLPATLRDMLLARIHALDPGAQAVVRVAAVGGRDVHHELLAAAAGLPEPELSDVLRGAVREHVLVAVDDGYAFRHALFSEAAYGELLPGERARLHAAFAAALEARAELAGGNTATVAAEIAHHWLRAGDEPRALAAAVCAGTGAELVGALAEAVEHDKRALALWERVPDAERLAGIDRAALLARAADAAAWTGDAAGAIELVDAAIALHEAAAERERVAVLLQQRARFLWQLGRAPESVPDLERAVALIPSDPPTAARAQALGSLGVMVMLSGQYTRSRTYAEQALAVARATGARAEEAVALNCLGIDLDALGDRAAGHELLRQGWSIATDVGRADVLSQAALLLSDALRNDGQLERSTEIALEGAEVARRTGLEMFERMCKCNAAQAAFELGRWDLVDRISREMLARDFSGMTLAFAQYLAGELARARGDLAGAAAHLAAQVRAVGPGPTPPASYAIDAEAELALWEGRPEVALRAAEEGLRLQAEDPVRWMLIAALGAHAAADLAELARARRDAAAETAARERATAFRDGARDRTASAAHPALAATIEAEHARAAGDSDPTSWDAAARAWEARPGPFQAAYARWRQAEAALARRDRAQADQALHAAHATATSLGARALGAEIEALARRARIALAPARDEPATADLPPAGADLGLTARELEVLQHLARGATNRQIAEALYISVRTAGVHVSHILGKLSAANRGEAAAIAHRLGLAP
jgi:DNA-binding CsgD family transcriptional regulator/tetratricopeptide (TPR) repeat protein